MGKYDDSKNEEKESQTAKALDKNKLKEELDDIDRELREMEELLKD